MPDENALFKVDRLVLKKRKRETIYQLKKSIVGNYTTETLLHNTKI